MLWLRTVAFALVVPGTVAVAVPLLLSGRAHAASPGPARWLGAILAPVGWLLLGWCCRDFVVRGRGTPNPLDPPRALVMSGPYRFTRNPMYVGALLSIVGIGAFTGARAVLLYAVGFFLVAHLFVRLHEERRLRREFGAEYDRYRARVPRWIGLPRAPLAPLLLILLLATPAGAQLVRGTATSGRAPVPGVVLLLVDSAGATVRRALADESGTFALAAPAPGRYRLRTLRIGYRPMEVGPLALRAGGDTTLRLALEAVPVALARVVVTARRGQCGARADAATASAALWEAVRAALEAQQATAAARRYEMRLARRERRYDADGATVREAARTEIESSAQQSFGSLPADSLAAVGYVTPASLVTSFGGEVEFRGPDAQVLLSDRFARDHCFEVVASPDREQRLLGLAFRPAAPAGTPGGRVDVRGTLWVDRLTSELRRIEFAYEGLPAEARGRSGGWVEYLPLSTGGWIIREWEIRMPVMRDGSVRGTDPTTGRPGLRRRLLLEGVHASGGSVVDVRARGRTLWTARTARLEGVVRGVGRGPAPRLRVAHAEGGAPRLVSLDSLGRFRVDSVVPGPYRLVLAGHPADSLGLAPDTVQASATDGAPATVELRPPRPAEVARRLCGREARDSSARAIVGTARDAAGAPLAGVAVLATYLVDARFSGPPSVVFGRREARTDHAGSFLVCDVSPDRPIELRVTARDGANATVTVRLRPERGYGVADLRTP